MLYCYDCDHEAGSKADCENCVLYLEALEKSKVYTQKLITKGTKYLKTKNKDPSQKQIG